MRSTTHNNAYHANSLFSRTDTKYDAVSEVHLAAVANYYAAATDFDHTAFETISTNNAKITTKLLNIMYKSKSANRR